MRAAEHRAVRRLDPDHAVLGMDPLPEPREVGGNRQLQLTEPDARVAADPLQLSRALRNLVLNAMDAMPGGGTLRIRTERHEDVVRIEVSDSGDGLTEEECARLFTPYYTTKHHGTGLGLAIVQSVVSDHHGKISVVSQSGQGATFVIDLRVHQESRS